MIFSRTRQVAILFATAVCVSAWALPPYRSAAVLNQIDVARMSGAGQNVRKIVIANGIYQFMVMRDNYVRQLNSEVVVNENDVLVFDTDTRPSTARLILAEIRKITDKPVRYVVNSHWHPDHWSGNEVYTKAFPELEIIATEKTREFMQNVADAWPGRFTAELNKRKTAFAEESSAGLRLGRNNLKPPEVGSARLRRTPSGKQRHGVLPANGLQFGVRQSDIPHSSCSLIDGIERKVATEHDLGCGN
jgi:hypothetical protein